MSIDCSGSDTSPLPSRWRDLDGAGMFAGHAVGGGKAACEGLVVLREYLRCPRDRVPRRWVGCVHQFGPAGPAVAVAGGERGEGGAARRGGGDDRVEAEPNHKRNRRP